MCIFNTNPKRFQYKHCSRPSEKYRLIFIHIPKVAGSSIEDSLKLMSTNHYTALECKELYPEVFDSYFKFCFVRNPFTRLFSAFNHMKNGKELDKLGFSSNNIEFCQFVEDLYSLKQNFTKKGEAVKDALINKVHIWTQACFVLDENKNIMVDFVGRFENLENDWSSICQKNGIGHVDLLHRGKSITLFKKDVYNAKTRDMVIELYEDDFKFFGYGYDIPDD